MSAVVEQISEIQKAQVVPFPVPLPAGPGFARAAGVHDRGVCARTLDEFETPLKNDGQELLKSRFLCKGGGLLLVGPTGIGKSSLSMQMMISWALGKGLFGIEPARPITSLLIQAENDDGDLAEMRNGVFSGLNLTDAERTLACSHIFVVQENARTSEDFFNKTVRPMLQEIKPDLLWIDPALSYLGGENNSQEAVGTFLRNQLNPLLTAFSCGAVVIHHTNKPYTGPEKRGPSDPAYLGSGSAEWANWSRAILTLRTTKQANVFELRAAKRGNRLGWREADGTTTAYNRFIAHNREPGTICWVDVVQDVAVALEKSSGRSAQDILKQVPLDRPIAKNTLIKTCADNGVGVNAARPLIDELVDGGELFVWTKPRQGTKPEIYLARVAQPVDANGQKIFTEIITAILPHENAREDETERSSHLHPPLGGVKIDREDREHQKGVALLPVNGTKPREDDSHEDTLPKPPACFQLPNATAPRTMTAPEQPEREQIETVLVTLAEILTKDELHVPWMNMKAVAKACQNHCRQLDKVAYGYPFKARQMEEQAVNLFEKRQLIVTDKVKIEYRKEPKERAHRNDNNYEFQLAFHKFDPVNDAHHLVQEVPSAH